MAPSREQCPTTINTAYSSLSCASASLYPRNNQGLTRHYYSEFYVSIDVRKYLYKIMIVITCNSVLNLRTWSIYTRCSQTGKGHWVFLNLCTWWKWLTCDFKSYWSSLSNSTMHWSLRGWGGWAHFHLPSCICDSWQKHTPCLWPHLCEAPMRRNSWLNKLRTHILDLSAESLLYHATIKLPTHWNEMAQQRIKLVSRGAPIQ